MKEWNANTIRMAKARKLLSATLVPDIGRSRFPRLRQKKTALASPESEDPAASARYSTAFRRPYNGRVPSRKDFHFGGEMVPRGGIEPPTPAFSVQCSTN